MQVFGGPLGPAIGSTPSGLPFPSRPPAARAQPLATLGSPDWRAARHQATIGTGIERDRALSMMHNAPIACRMASPGVLCIRSVLNTPRLGSGAGDGAPCIIAVTVSRRSVTHSPRAPGSGPIDPAHPTNPLPSPPRLAPQAQLRDDRRSTPHTARCETTPGCVDCLSRPRLTRHGLGSGAGAVVLSSIPVTVSTHLFAPAVSRLR